MFTPKKEGSFMKMPVLFIGHGSPMNIIETNDWTKQWNVLGESMPKPKAILMISAHWYTRATYIQTAPAPTMLYDMYGFPPELYEYVYPAKTDATLIQEVKSLLGDMLQEDTERPYDHGNYAVLCHVYPNADIPVVQLSVDGTKPASYHYELGKKLARLREEGYLIIGSGNVVHNLRLMDGHLPAAGFAWAEDFGTAITTAILDRDTQTTLNWEKLPGASKAAESPDHLLPLFYVLGASDENDTVKAFNQDYLLGSLNMTGYYFTPKE